MTGPRVGGLGNSRLGNQELPNSGPWWQANEDPYGTYSTPSHKTDLALPKKKK